MAKIPKKAIWAPTVDFHDPNPPLSIESSGGIKTAELHSVNSGDAQFISGAVTVKETVWNSVGAADALFRSQVTLETVLNSQGQSAAIFRAPATVIVEAEFNAVGSSPTEFTASRKRVARCLNAFTYTPPPVPVWAGTLRRQPMIQVHDMVDDSVNTSAFTDTVEPALGSDVQMDIEGTGRLLGGTILSTDMHPDGDQKDSWVWDTRVVDYMWLLNGRRPFGCWTNISATTVILDMMAEFGPVGFTTNNVAAGLPAITIIFDGSLTFSECLQSIASRLGGAHFRVDDDRDLHFFFAEVTDNPTIIDDNNTLLSWDIPITLSKDISQIRNRVFVKGAGATLLEDALAGATELEIDGLDVFNPNGGYAIINCNRIHYTGVLRSLIYPPLPTEIDQLVKAVNPDARTYTPGSPSGFADDLHEGPIGTRVRYSVTYVINRVETPRGHEIIIDPQQVSPGVGFLPFPRLVTPGAGFAVGDAVLAGWVTTSGKVIVHTAFSTAYASALNMVPSSHAYTIQTTNSDPRVARSRIWRRMPWIDADWHEVSTVNKGGVHVDVKDPASVGSYPDIEDDLFFFSGQMQNDSGSRVWITDVPQGPLGTTERRLYREEQFGAYTSWTEPERVMVIDGNDTFIGPREDTKRTSVHAWARGFNVGDGDTGSGGAPAQTPAPPPEPQPKVKLTLIGVTGLDENVKAGDDVNIFIQRDSLSSQVASAVREGGSGLHEMMLVEPDLRSDAELIIRGDAELQLYSEPIITVNYSTRDVKSRSGKTVQFNLTMPPIVAELKITEVTIDQIHEADFLTERYSVTASSMKYTLEDLLRRARLR